MKSENVELIVTDVTRQIVSGMSRYDLQDLESAILNRRLELMAEQLEARGIHAAARKGTIDFCYLLVYSPENTGLPNAWATPDETCRLLDTLANLPPEEAYRRWYPKVEQLESEPYTRQEAIRDTRAARTQLVADLEAGKIDGREYADLYRTTSFMDLVE